MTRSEKAAEIEELKEKFSNSSFFYITDSSALTVEQVNKLRGLCFENDVEMRVAKNSLIEKAMAGASEDKNYGELLQALKGPTAIMFSEAANLPARLIKEFRADKERPIIKAAYIDSSVYLGDDSIDMLASLKSKEELVGEIIGLLQSPAKNVISALKSGSSTIAGILKTLEQRGE